MSNGKRMPDGTICWTGPKCRKHGAFFSKNPFKKLTQREQKPTQPLTEYEKEELEDLKELNQLYTNLYTHLTQTTPAPVNHTHQPETTPRKGLNGADKTKLNQLHLEAIQVRMELTPEEQTTLSSYQNSYEFVNAYLREGREGINKLEYLQRTSPHPTKPGQVADETLNRYEKMAEERIQKLDDTLNQHARKNTNQQILYRAFYLTPGSGQDHLTPEEYAKEQYPVGKIFEEPGYMSTSNDSDYMLLYNPHLYSKQIVFEIKTSKGTVLHNPADTPGGIGTFERETLLPRGMKYKVTNVTQATYQNTHEGKDYAQAKLRASKAEKEQTFTIIQIEEVI